jgi:hypothetical protein
MNDKKYEFMKIYCFIALAVVGLFTSCKEIISVNISSKTPVLILPKQDDTLQNNLVHFKWEELEGATSYRLQVVSPSFDDIDNYALDSVVTGTSNFFFLDSNQYEYKVTALNSGYESQPTEIVRFWIGTQNGGGSAQINLVSPAADTYFNESFGGVFNWQNTSNVTSYEFSLRKGTSYASPTIILTESGIVTTQLTLQTPLDQGEYHWGVLGYKDGNLTTSLSTRRFYIDTVNPLPPTLVAPSGFVSAGDLTFSWTNVSDPGVVNSPLTTYLQIAESADFSLGLVEEIVSSNSVIISITGSGTRYWRVQHIDAAGNVSSYSTIGQFTLF